MLRVLFMGTPDFAVPTLATLVAAGHEIIGVYTQPPRPAGRGLDERKSSIHRFADSAGLPVHTPRSLRGDEAARAIAAHAADVGVVVAYGLILPKTILELPQHGFFNLHASALPRWRGAAPIQRAIMAGDTLTAATVMRMEEGLDTGPVCLQESLPIGPDMVAGELHDLMAQRGADLMARALTKLEACDLGCIPQTSSGITYATKIGKNETRIDFSRSASEVHNHIRGLSPMPGAWFEPAVGGERIKVLRSTLVDGAGPAGTVLDDALTVACGMGAVRIEEVQRAGKRPMTARDFLRGFALPAGTLLQPR
jgi:methionyl-tRNA formyltransferase